MKIEIELDASLAEKIAAMAKEQQTSSEAIAKMILAKNYWETPEQIEKDVDTYAEKGEKLWLKVNLRDGQTFYGSIVAVQGSGKMKKIVLRNIFQELEYDIFLDLIATIEKPNEERLGPDKEYFLQPRQIQKE